MIDAKRCPKCKETKTLDSFSRDRTKRDGLQVYCRPCKLERQRTYSKEWGKRNHRRIHLKRRYNMTEQQYQEYYAVQDGKCRICQMALATLNVDHCHKTGAIRGLLCFHCNAALGHLRDSVELLEAAIRYLAGGNMQSQYSNKAILIAKQTKETKAQETKKRNKKQVVNARNQARG